MVAWWRASRTREAYRSWLLVVRPEAQDLDHALLLQDLVHQTMLNVDPARKGAGQVPHEPFEGRRCLEKGRGATGRGASPRGDANRNAPAFERPSAPGQCRRRPRAGSPPGFSRALPKGRLQALADGGPHAGNGQQVERLLNGAPV